VSSRSRILDVPGIVLTLVGVFVAWRTVLLLINWRVLRDARGRWSLGFATIPIVAVAAALIMHSVVFHLAGMPLPKDRTGIYIVVLSTLFLGSLAAIRIPTRAGEASRRGLTILMVVLGSYFLLCLRISYFKEWKWDSDTDKIYSILADYNHACGLKDIAVNWRYDSSLNFYRIISGQETIPEFAPFEQYSAGKRAFVVYEPDDHDFLRERALTVVHRFPSGAAIALDPEIEPPPGESACPLNLPNH
jgi:hypothetical protein